MKLPTLSPERALILLRIGVAALLIIHGVTRSALGIVDDFGGFFSSRGFPFGTALAWAITIVEIAGGLTLAAGRWVRPLCAWFAIQLLAGIAMIHASEGWFVVGAGRNGMEYSVLLVICLITVALGTDDKRGQV